MLATRLDKMIRVALSPACWRGVPHLVLASFEHRHALGIFRKMGCRTIVDVGANRGQFALAAHALVPEAKILSFEPLSQPAKRFKSVFKGASRVAMQEVAIGPRAGVATMHVSARDDSSSLLPIAQMQTSVFPGTAEVGQAQVTVMKLSDIVSASEIAAPAVLKIDVQGYEMETLRGCESLLGHFAWIYVECSFAEFYEGQALAPEVIRYLDERGYGIDGIYNITHDKSGRSIQADFLFANREKFAGNCRQLLPEPHTEKVDSAPYPT